MMSVQEAAGQFLTHIPLMGLLRFKRAGGRMLRRMECDSWDSNLLHEIYRDVYQKKESCSQLLSHALPLFLILGSDSAPLDRVRDVIAHPTDLQGAGSYFWFHWGFPMEEMAARSAKVLGDDALAERYVERLTCYNDMFPFVRCNTLALRGRIAARRGDREAALGMWKLAADIAIAEMVPLLALCVGLDCGEEEGEIIQSAASEAVGRPFGTVLDELLAATEDAMGNKRIKFKRSSQISTKRRYSVESLGKR